MGVGGEMLEGQTCSIGRAQKVSKTLCSKRPLLILVNSASFQSPSWLHFPTPQGPHPALTEFTSSQLFFITFSFSIITFLKAGAGSDEPF